MSGYKITPETIVSTKKELLTYHRLIEAFKFAFALRTDLADPDFDSNVTAVSITSQGVYSVVLLEYVCLMVFNATFNNISIKLWRSVLLVEETRVPGENQRLVASR